MKKYQNIVKQYFLSMRTFEKIEKTPKDFGTGDLLYKSEIHTLVAIGKNPESNMTELAKIMGITKGGVQKFVKKLLAKDLIYRKQLITNKKEVLYELTAKGKIAFQGHNVYAKKQFGEIYEIMDDMKKEELEVLETFLKKLNEAICAGE